MPPISTADMTSYLRSVVTLCMCYTFTR